MREVLAGGCLVVATAFVASCGGATPPPPAAVPATAAPAPAAQTSGCDPAVDEAVRALLYRGADAKLSIAKALPVRLPGPACAVSFYVSYEQPEDDDAPEDDDDDAPSYAADGSGSGLWIVDGSGKRLADPVELEPHESDMRLTAVADFDGDGIDEILIEWAMYGELTLNVLRWRGTAFETTLEVPLRTSPDGSGEEDGEVVCTATYAIGEPGPSGGQTLTMTRTTSSEGAVTDPARSGCPAGTETITIPQQAAD